MKREVQYKEKYLQNKLSSMHYMPTVVATPSTSSSSTPSGQAHFLCHPYEERSFNLYYIVNIMIILTGPIGHLIQGERPKLTSH